MKGKNLLIPGVIIVGSLALFGCADDEAASSGGSAPQSTSLSIDTDEGAFSYKNDGGGESTSVSVDTDGDGKDK
ncbi:hypothetical protein NCG89_03310 [Spongiibacter taiwanensis]|uniref:hypothetical protein n=1 Tax=Spongiibacter taiwanensis TaxID=1748242 RepID=UPI0020354E5A|nr:hypothetical protein [Spongiibacter taiwanensis]USA43820.1 hypothetical protein NCG89_03310 [Spongiibacter taiwanensis]